MYICPTDSAHPLLDSAHPLPDSVHPLPDSADPLPGSAQPLPDSAHPLHCVQGEVSTTLTHAVEFLYHPCKWEIQKIKQSEEIKHKITACCP